MSKFTVIKEEKIVDPNTGEVKYLDTIERKPQEVISVFDPYKKAQRRKHVKRNSSIEIRKLCLLLNNDCKAFLFAVQPYLQWETNLLVGDGVTAGKKDQPLIWKDIDRLTGMDKRTRQKVIKQLSDENLIAYLESNHKRKGIVINPSLMLNGRIPAEALLNAFSTNECLED